MLIATLLVIGYSINLSHEATIVSQSLPSQSFNKSLELDSFCEIKKQFNGDSIRTTYVKLPPGRKIYFYPTENENVVMGPKLRSDDPIEISFVNPGDDSGDESKCYAALKSGVLVPRPIRRNKIESDDSLVRIEERPRNGCVYQSLTPAHYIKSFKNILIPAEILCSRSKRGDLFEGMNPESKTSSKPGDSKGGEEEGESEAFEDVESGKKSTTFHSSKRNRKTEGLKQEVDNFRENEISEGEEEILPDKTCDGEVTLFVLRNDGVLKRISADPYMPIGLRLTYSLSRRNLVFRPKFLGGSDLVVSYVTGENGDLVPHSDNAHRITAEVGRSVSFMLSKNGGLFPVEERKKGDNLVGYYFKGRLIHEGDQFGETHSNSTSILINGKRIGPADDSGDDVGESRASNEISEKPRRKGRGHHLRKREAYYNGYDRGGVGSGHSHSAMEPPSMMRHLPPGPDQNRITEYSYPALRSQPYYVGPPNSYASEPSSPANDHYGDSRHSDIAEGLPQPSPAAKAASLNFEIGTSKPASRFRSSMYSEPMADPLEPQREEPSSELTSSSSPSSPSSSPNWDNSALRPRTDLFIFDEKGVRIRLIPEITNTNDVVIYKLTCKGNLVRYPSCKEPEFGFEINFHLLLDEFVLVPTVSIDPPYHLTFVLQENGDLIPAKDNANTFRKAPGSLIYYMLGKNNVLFPVQQVIDADGNVSFFYQDYLLLKIKDSIEKPLHFTTKGSPLFAFFNGLTMIAMSSKPRLNPRGGSNWKHLKPSERPDPPTKTMYLTGPKGELIKITPYKNREGATVVYELDCNGILYRSPKDKKKCIILKSYILLKEGILLPSNDTNGYVYMMSKNGDLFPYLYPDGKIEAPLASSLKYVLCEKGILLPIKLEIIDNSVCYLFRDVVVYKERVYCRSCLDRLDEKQLDYIQKYKKSSCDLNRANQTNDPKEKGIDLFVNKNGDHVFYEKRNKLLKRHPPEVIPSYLKYTMGSFEIKSDGSLYQIRYQNPTANVVNLMLEPNGDLLEDTRNVNNVRSDYYLLDATGNLISVEARKTKKYLHFYKGLTRVCKVPIPDEPDEKVVKAAVAAEEIRTPLGKDPLRLLEDPFPVEEGKGGGAGAGTGDSRSLYIPIPLKSVSVSNPAETYLDRGDPEQKKKCEMLKDALKQVSKGNPLPLALELELTDDIIEELKNWADKCDKVLSRRDVASHLSNYLNDFNFLGLRCDSNLGKMNLPISLLF